MTMPAAQNRSNIAFREGLIRLATVPNAKSGLKKTAGEAFGGRKQRGLFLRKDEEIRLDPLTKAR